MTVEDHNTVGGLGTAVADVMASIKSRAVLRKIGVNDLFGESGNQAELYKKHGLNPDQISQRVLMEMETLK